MPVSQPGGAAWARPRRPRILAQGRYTFRRSAERTATAVSLIEQGSGLREEQLARALTGRLPTHWSPGSLQMQNIDLNNPVRPLEGGAMGEA